ncbi:ATP-binding protein [Glycomyces albidus]|uniref:AAA family ATPase n=1 Tax=Glycomyces albidus TaxID=2656774 RepID=A0A6L5GBR3_9ACTN|nr:LuxR C-terminal-related transcriptional regulator [Glycomyces albidus]MQM27026.1 AAA family ATPase [Glycomyces albidus]
MPPFIARDAELARIGDAWDRLRAGGGPVAVTVVGEAGIGKTRLLREAVAAVAPPLLLFGTARADGAAPHDWFAAATAETDPPDGTDERLWRVLRQEPADAPMRLPDGALLRGAMRTLRRITGGGPALIAVDDLHWLDPESLALWSEMAAALDFPALLLAAGRPPEEARHPAAAARTLARLAGTPDAAAIALRPFTVAETGTLLGGPSGPVPHAEARAVHRRTGGNPFWVKELAAAGAAAAPLPGHLASLVRARLAGEDEPAWRLARGLALLGERTDTAVAAAVLGADLLETALPRLAAAGVIRREDTGLRFPHALMREAFAATALPAEAEAVHRAALALALDRGDDPAVAVHAHALGDTDLAAAAADRTAARQLESWLVESAQRTAEHALALAPDHPGLLDTAGHAALLSGDYAAARTHYERLTAAADDRVRCIAHLRLAEIDWHQGRIQDQWRSLEAAEALAAPGSVEQARCATGRAMAYVRSADYEPIPALCDATEPLYERHGLHMQRRSAAISRATAMYYLGDTEAAVRILTGVWRDAEADGDLRKLGRAVNNLLAVHLADLPEPQAWRLFDRAVAAVGDLGMAAWGGKITRVGADAAIGFGDLERAWTLLRPRARVESDPHERAVLAAKAGLLAVERGDLDEAERLCREGLDLVAGMDQGWVVTYPHWLAAAIAAHRGDRGELRAAVGGYRDAVPPDLHRLREPRVIEVARLALDRGIEPAAARRFLTDCLGAVPAPGSSPYADLMWMEARIRRGDWPGALALFDGAAAVDQPHERSTARILAAEANRRLGDRDAALAHAAEAVALLRRWPGHRRDAAAALLDSLSRTPMTEALTARETEVLQAAAQGASNRQIAAALGISQRTVEVHMSRLLAKTGSASRTELVARYLQDA